MYAKNYKILKMKSSLDALYANPPPVIFQPVLQVILLTSSTKGVKKIYSLFLIVV